MTAIDELRRLLDERSIKWWEGDDERKTLWESNGLTWEYFNDENGDAWLGFLGACEQDITPEQAIAATLGRESWVNPTWERWHKSLKHDEIKSIGDAVEQLMYEAIEFGGDMGPNGNTYNGIDEGDVLTSGFINEWIMRFESTLGRDKYSYKQWSEISNAVGDAMEYAHDKAIECPDKADPLWNLDEYVNRILKAAFEGETTLGDAPRLPYFWTHDGTLHIELPKLPESISVRLPDKRDREVRSARVWQYTLGVNDSTPTRQGAGTCKDACNRFNAWVCSECGATLLLMFDDYGEPSYSVDGVADVPHFCPNCGRKVVNE